MVAAAGASVAAIAVAASQLPSSHTLATPCHPHAYGYPLPCRCSPNLLASGGADGELCIWDVGNPMQPSLYPAMKGGSGEAGSAAAAAATLALHRHTGINGRRGSELAHHFAAAAAAAAAATARHAWGWPAGLGHCPAAVDGGATSRLPNRMLNAVARGTCVPSSLVTRCPPHPATHPVHCCQPCCVCRSGGAAAGDHPPGVEPQGAAHPGHLHGGGHGGGVGPKEAAPRHLIQGPLGVSHTLHAGSTASGTACSTVRWVGGWAGEWVGWPGAAVRPAT